MRAAIILSQPYANCTKSILRCQSTGIGHVNGRSAFWQSVRTRLASRTRLFVVIVQFRAIDKDGAKPCGQAAGMLAHSSTWWTQNEHAWRSPWSCATRLHPDRSLHLLPNGLLLSHCVDGREHGQVRLECRGAVASVCIQLCQQRLRIHILAWKLAISNLLVALHDGLLTHLEHQDMRGHNRVLLQVGSLLPCARKPIENKSLHGIFCLLHMLHDHLTDLRFICHPYLADVNPAAAQDLASRDVSEAKVLSETLAHAGSAHAGSTGNNNLERTIRVLGVQALDHVLKGILWLSRQHPLVCLRNLHFISLALRSGRVLNAASASGGLALRLLASGRLRHHHILGRG
mmetsp:Transcript_125200/g.221907  ORF Transcript_125200/g.221907 Transcript_125200/m.221907 type:complete len:345 (+) Transcript_125200:466-1500(+)